MADFNVDLSEVQQAQEMVAQKETNEVVESDDDDEEEGNNIVFWIIMGVLSVFTIGVPILVYFIVKNVKQKKQLQKQIDDAAKTDDKSAEETKTEETKQEAVQEEKKDPEK